jgi:hypothetical protein
MFISTGQFAAVISNTIFCYFAVRHPSKLLAKMNPTKVLPWLRWPRLAEGAG